MVCAALCYAPPIRRMHDSIPRKCAARYTAPPEVLLFMWQARNKVIFNNEPVCPQNVVHAGNQFATSWLEAVPPMPKPAL